MIMVVPRMGRFIIIEYVDGINLQDRCRDGALPLEEAVDLTCQLCDGLSRAHDQGIVHRDIKPANVLLTKNGVPKLTDFGLAKADATDHQMTVAGAVLGTPDFMPPEQRRDAAEVDARSDLWSLAATLYQMVTGRSPKIIRFRDVPDELEDILGKALEESKDDRFQTIKEFRDALKSSLTTDSASSKPIQVAGTLAEGQCKACGTVTNDLNKKFCRNPECGASLRVVCLKCEVQIPVWDGICGECGGNQKQIFSQKQADFDKACQHAEELAAEFQFESSKAALKPWLGLDQRFDDIKSKAASLLSVTETAESQAREHRDSHVSEARLHFSAKDYDSVIATLALIPSRMATNESGQLLTNARACAQERQVLLEQIKSSLKVKSYSGLLAKVQRALELTDGRSDLEHLVETLYEREQKQKNMLKNVRAKAAAYADKGQYGKASQLLERLGEGFAADVFVEFQRYSLLEQESQQLRTQIKTLWKTKETRPLLRKITRALELHPGSEELKVLQEKATVLDAKSQEQAGLFFHEACLAFDNGGEIQSCVNKLDKCRNYLSVEQEQFRQHLLKGVDAEKNLLNTITDAERDGEIANTEIKDIALAGLSCLKARKSSVVGYKAVAQVKKRIQSRGLSLAKELGHKTVLDLWEGSDGTAQAPEIKAWLREATIEADLTRYLRDIVSLKDDVLAQQSLTSPGDGEIIYFGKSLEELAAAEDMSIKGPALLGYCKDGIVVLQSEKCFDAAELVSYKNISSCIISRESWETHLSTVFAIMFAISALHVVLMYALTGYFFFPVSWSKLNFFGIALIVWTGFWFLGGLGMLSNGPDFKLKISPPGFESQIEALKWKEKGDKFQQFFHDAGAGDALRIEV